MSVISDVDSFPSSSSSFSESYRIIWCLDSPAGQLPPVVRMAVIDRVIDAFDLDLLRQE